MDSKQREPTPLRSQVMVCFCSGQKTIFSRRDVLRCREILRLSVGLHVDGSNRVGDLGSVCGDYLPDLHQEVFLDFQKMVPVAGENVRENLQIETRLAEAQETHAHRGG